MGLRAAMLSLALLIAGLTGCAHRRAVRYPDPASARRFAILSTSDTLLRFSTTNARWVRRGTVGLAVDPRRHDALVARYVVQRVDGDTAIALVTGLTTDLSSEHVALLSPPRIGLLRHRAFWIGVASGSVAGIATVAGLR